MELKTFHLFSWLNQDLPAFVSASPSPWRQIKWTLLAGLSWCSFRTRELCQLSPLFHLLFLHFSVITLNKWAQLSAIKNTQSLCPASSSINGIQMEAAWRRALWSTFRNRSPTSRASLEGANWSGNLCRRKQPEVGAGGPFHQALLQPIQQN